MGEQLFSSVSNEVLQLCLQSGFQRETDIRETLRNLWLPLAIDLAQYRTNRERPIIQGILGGQGTGKSTLASILKLILRYIGYHALCLSLDDLYKRYTDRQALREREPRLKKRGPPGTHDIELGLRVLSQLQQPQGLTQIEIPRFDKSAWGGEGDRSEPELVSGVDIVLFEGWFVGVRPIDPAAFDSAPPPIITESDRIFARDMNTTLQDYLPLWDRLDRLMLLYPVDYHLSVEWRQQAEHQMIASGKSGMSDAEIEEFVNYFWKALHPELFIKPLKSNSELVDMVIEINPDRTFGRVRINHEH